MKTSLALLFALLVTAPLLAQDSGNEVMENADMSDGSTHWHGDCKTAGSDGTTDFTSPGSGGSQGIVVDLHSSSWTKITQEIHSKSSDKESRGVVLTVVYQTTPDFKLSDRPTDYGNVGPALEFGGAKLPGVPGRILAFIDEPPSSRSSVSAQGSTNVITIYSDDVAVVGFAPATDQKPQTFTAQLRIPGYNGSDNPTFCLAFPPGSGSVTITKISLASGGQ